MTIDKQFVSACNHFLQTSTEEYTKELHICILQCIKLIGTRPLTCLANLDKPWSKPQNLVKITVF